jgi:DNA-directed RNA polymerase specialized sigma24 family protein
MFDEVLKSREGISYDRGTAEDRADSRRVVTWLESSRSKDAKKYVAEALIRIWGRGKDFDGDQP